MPSRTVEKALVLIAALFMVLSASILVIKYTNWRITLLFSHTSTSRLEQTIAGYLREFPVKSEIREKAIGILKEYLGKSGVVLKESVSVSARSSSRVKLTLYSGTIYELIVSVSGSCLGTCDIYLKLLDSNYRTAIVKTLTGSSFIMGRYSSLHVNFTLHSIEEEGEFYLELDNS
jgi:hypothetical protein